MGASRRQDIYEHLKKAGFNVFFSGQHEGDCILEYVVVKENETLQFNTYSSTTTYYDILCYVPIDRVTRVDSFFEEVKEAMRGLVPMIKPAHSETAEYIDDDIKARMKSARYLNYRRFQ